MSTPSLPPTYQGRVDLSGSKSARDYPVFAEANADSWRSTFQEETTRGIVQPTSLSDLFFSKLNRDALQLGLQRLVYKDTKKIIGRQSDVELEIIMRSVFLQYARHMPFEVVEQVRELNARVLDYAVPRVVREIQQNATYRADIQRLPVPMERSQNVSSAGTKFLHMKEF